MGIVANYFYGNFVWLLIVFRQILDHFSTDYNTSLLQSEQTALRKLYELFFFPMLISSCFFTCTYVLRWRAFPKYKCNVIIPQIFRFCFIDCSHSNTLTLRRRCHVCLTQSTACFRMLVLFHQHQTTFPIWLRSVPLCYVSASQAIDIQI